MTYYKYKMTMGAMLLSLMVFSYISFVPEWDTLLFRPFIHFLQYIDFPMEGWVFLDKYFYNGEL